MKLDGRKKMKNIGEVILKLEIERYKKTIENIFVFMILLYPFILALLFIAISNYPSTNLNLEHSYKNLSIVHYSDLNVSEIEIVKSLIGELKPEYYNLASNITFSKNQSFVESKSDYKGIGMVVGVNIDNGKDIYVLYRNNLVNRTKEILCHELLHGLFFFEDVFEEWFVKDIEKYNVCYERYGVFLK